jgi:arabinose-5-phosphate isomerase
MTQEESFELTVARQVLQEEADGIRKASLRLTSKFVNIIEVLLHCSGKIVCSGVGKSGIIAHKLSATLSSTGSPSLFLEAMTALHGDLGVLQAQDVLVVISNSGETGECLQIMDYAEELTIPMIALVGNPNSKMAKKANYFLHVGVEKEAGHLGLAPTTSTTVALAVGDALAMTLEWRKSFRKEQFHKYHPSGSLSAHLKVLVADLMHREQEIPSVQETQSLKEALKILQEKKFGVVLVVNPAGQLLGTFTDGDLRRLLVKTDQVLDFSIAISKVCSHSPRYIRFEMQAVEALAEMEAHQITTLPVLDAQSRPIGILHIHDLLGRGGLNYL